MSEGERKYKKRLYDIEYNKKNIVRIKEFGLKRRKKNRIKKKEYDIKYRNDLRNKFFEILGSECSVCKNNDKKFLTFDHIHNNGAEKRKIWGNNRGEIVDFKKRGWPADEIKDNFRVLCYNHNCSASRGYLNETLSTSKYKRYRKKLWEQAYEFFGPCSCGQKNVQFLTISHIHNDGAKRRRNGEKRAADLLSQFRRKGWSESLKEDFCLECYNCNCGRYYSGQKQDQQL